MSLIRYIAGTFLVLIKNWGFSMFFLNKVFSALVYPGARSLFLHRLSMFFFLRGMKRIALIVSQLSRFLSGIEIEPGASIASGVIISHGMGVVIGHSAIVENNVLIRQGVTLGAGNFRPVDSSLRIHPKVEEFCAIGAGAVILGPVTIGHHSVVGANAVVTKDVAPYSVVAGIPARVIREVKDSSGLPWTFE